MLRARARIHRDVAVLQARRHEPRAEVQDEQLEHPRGDPGDALLRADLEVQERKAHAPLGGVNGDRGISIGLVMCRCSSGVVQVRYRLVFGRFRVKPIQRRGEEMGGPDREQVRIESEL